MNTEEDQMPEKPHDLRVWVCYGWGQMGLVGTVIVAAADAAKALRMAKTRSIRVDHDAHEILGASADGVARVLYERWWEA